MQKSLLIVLLIVVLGTWAIFQFSPDLHAAVAFIIGAVVSSITFIVNGSFGAQSSVTYSGPTKTLYVGNLPYRVHESEVKQLFEQYGAVKSVRLVRDRKTGRRKGFGFVEIAASAVDAAMQQLNDYSFQERTLKVREAKSQEPNS